MISIEMMPCHQMPLAMAGQGPAAGLSNVQMANQCEAARWNIICMCWFTRHAEEREAERIAASMQSEEANGLGSIASMPPKVCSLGKDK